jgi:long-chain acyl-CoA synthetase
LSQKGEYPVERCFLARVYAAARRHPPRIALEVSGPEGKVTTSYEQLLRQVEGAAAKLRDLDIGPGERVALLLPNHPRWCASFLAILHRRAVAVPLDVHYNDEELKALLEDCGARAAFASEEFAKRLRGLQKQLPELRHILPVDLWSDPDADAGPPLPPEWGGPQDLVSLMYTSGTTGDPKGVMLDNANVLAELDGLVDSVGVDQSDSILSLLPLTHVLAQLANLLFPLVVGARTVFVAELTTGAISRALQEGGITVFGGVPQLFYLFHQRILGEVEKKGALATRLFQLLLRLNGVLRSGLGLNLGRILFGRVHQGFGGRIKLLYCGASYLDPEVVRDFFRLGFNFLQGYGLTETTGAATFTPLEDNRIGTVGRPLKGVELRIDQPNPEGEGEVLIRGPIVMQGYFNKPERSAEVLRDGWFHTGDLGRLDRDGHLTLTGRAKDVIVLANGKNIYPEELERHYGQIPYIQEICVLGVRQGKSRAGEEMLYAVIVPNFDQLKADGIASAAESIRYYLENASTELPHYKRVLSFELRSEPLPRTTTRKIRRHLVQEQLTFGAGQAEVQPPELSAEDQELLGSREGQAVAAAIRASGRDQSLRLSHHLEMDLGYDSLSRVELLAGIEEQLGVRLDEQTSSSLATVGDVIGALQAAAPAGPGSAKRRGTSWPELLAEARGDESLRAYFHTGPLNALIFHAALRVIAAVARTILRLEASGLEHVPQQGPYLICPNHQSFIDGFLVGAALPFRATRSLFHLGQANYFHQGAGRWFAKLARIVPVSADANLLQAMRVAAAGLDMGKILSIYPEGERSIDGRLKRFKKGAAILARELKAPIVPVAIAGAYRVWARASGRIRFEKVRVRFGAPIDVAPFAAMSDAEAAYVALNDKLRAAVAELLTQLDPEAVSEAA